SRPGRAGDSAAQGGSPVPEQARRPLESSPLSPAAPSPRIESVLQLPSLSSSRELETWKKATVGPESFTPEVNSLHKTMEPGWSLDAPFWRSPAPDFGHRVPQVSAFVAGSAATLAANRAMRTRPRKPKTP